MRSAALVARGIAQSILTMNEVSTGALGYQGRRVGREFNLLHTNSPGACTLAPPALVDLAIQ